MENVAQKLFNLLGTKFDNTDIKTLDSTGKETTDMEEIEMFSFDFEAEGRNYGPVVILLSAEDNLEIYYGDNTSKTLDKEAKKKWENLIEHLSTFARTNRLGFSLKHTTDLKYDLSNIADITESYKSIFEGYYGTSKTSYKPQGKAKIIIKHSKKLGEEDARFRNISALFIENSEGERFKLPFKKLAGARAMARHVSEGGNPYDLFGLHISEMVKDINTLGGFVRRSKMYEDNDETKGLVEAGRKHYDSLRKDLKRIAGKRGYHTYKEGWEPSEITEQDKDVDSIRSLFTERSIDSRIEEALPLLARLEELAEKQVAETSDVTDFNPPSQGGTRRELLAKIANTLDPKEVSKLMQAARKAGATQEELKQAEKESIRKWNAQPGISGIQNRGGYETMDWPKETKMKEVDEFEDWAESVVEGTWAIPETAKQIRQLKKWLSEEQPVGIDALNATEELYDLIGDDGLFDDLEELSQKNPEADARPIVLKWLKRNMPKVREKVATEGCDKDLDADSEKHLNASINKDLNKYSKDKKVLSTQTKESQDMNELSKYMDEVEGVKEELKDVMESKEQQKEEPKEEPVDLKALMERTNYLLKK